MPSKRLALWAIGLYHASNDSAGVAVAAVFPILLTEGLITSYTGIGQLTLVALLVTVVCQILFGAWSDRVNPRLLLPLGMVLVGGFSLLTTQATSFVLLVLFVALARVGMSVYHPVGISWVGKAFKRDLDQAMGFQSAFGDLGVIVAFASSGFLGLRYGWQVPFLVWGGVALGAATVGYALTGGIERAPREVHRNPIRWAPLLRSLALWTLPMAMGGAAYIITISYGNSFLVERLALAEDAADGVIALWIGAGVLTAYSYGRITRLVGRFRSLALAFLLIAVSGFVISRAPPLGVLLPTFVLFGVGVFLTYPALFSFISESTEDRIGGATFGVVFGFQLVGGAAAGLGAGLAADRWGIHTPFLILTALGLVTLVFLLAMAPVALRGRPAPQAEGA